MMKFFPNGDRVAIRPFKEEEITSIRVSILVPFGQSKEAAQMGEIVAAGPDSIYKVQDKVIFNPYAGDGLRLQKEDKTFEELRIMHCDTVHCLFTDEEFPQ